MLIPALEHTGIKFDQPVMLFVMYLITVQRLSPWLCCLKCYLCQHVDADGGRLALSCYNASHSADILVPNDNLSSPGR